MFSTRLIKAYPLSHLNVGGPSSKMFFLFLPPLAGFENNLLFLLLCGRLVASLSSANQSGLSFLRLRRCALHANSSVKEPRCPATSRRVERQLSAAFLINAKYQRDLVRKPERRSLPARKLGGAYSVVLGLTPRGRTA